MAMVTMLLMTITEAEISAFCFSRCFVAEQYIWQQLWLNDTSNSKCLKKWTGSALLETQWYNFQPLHWTWATQYTSSQTDRQTDRQMFCVQLYDWLKYTIKHKKKPQNKHSLNKPKSAGFSTSAHLCVFMLVHKFQQYSTEQFWQSSLILHTRWYNHRSSHVYWMRGEDRGSAELHAAKYESPLELSLYL